MKRFNMNEYVYVKLNQKGLDELKRQVDELRATFQGLHPYEPPKIDENGYSKFQLHDLTFRLGHLCQLGFEPPFDTNILIANDKLHDIINQST